MSAVPLVMAGYRDKNIFMAKLAQETERYEEMSIFMENVLAALAPGDELTAEGRNLLFVAYKSAVDPRRVSLWNINAVTEEEYGGPALVQDYRAKIEAELTYICNRVLRLLDGQLVPAATGYESKVFFLKMKGDYHRYLAEFKCGDERIEAAKKTLSAYMAAQDIAVKKLLPTNSVRLQLALNISVFYYVVLNSPDRAAALAQKAFDEAAPELGTLREELNKSTAILDILRANLVLWTSEMQDDSADEIREAPKHDDDN